MEPAGGAPPASLIVIEPSGHRARVPLRPLPFRIGRQADNELVVRDSRASRTHARILVEAGQYVIEDAGSRHGVFVNGRRVPRQALQNSDHIEFGVLDSYQLIFALDGVELNRLMAQFADPSTTQPGVTAGPGSGLARLRAILEVARTLETGFSLGDVLNSVVDAALAVTGAERGFLLLRQGEELEMRVARSRGGARLEESDLRVPRRVIRRALMDRRDLFSMNFDPLAAQGAEQSVADLELRSCICVPLLRIGSGSPESTSVLSTGAETVGVLYLDSRAGAADLSGGNRELLQSFAIEVSTVLENARLLEEERGKQKIEEELRVARTIQQSLLPRLLPSDGWFRAAASSVASHQVGGDYYDFLRVSDTCWAAVVADVSGKGVSSALLASLLQGAFLATAHRWEGMPERIGAVNGFLHDRTGGEKYATMFYAMLSAGGDLHYVNAGHCPPVLVRAAGALEYLEPTGTPVGLLESAEFGAGRVALASGDKLVIYTDGVTEAQSRTGEFFGRKRLREIIREYAAADCPVMHEAIQTAVTRFTEGADQSDDLTLVVVEYRP